MAITLDATAGGASANTYVTLADAETYMEGRLYTTAWDAATDATKDKALAWASTILDDQFNWFGYQMTEEQALRWPRGAVYNDAGYEYDNEAVPTPLEGGAVELANILLQNDTWAEPGVLGQGLKEAKVGPITVKIDEAAQTELIPQNLRVQLSTLGSLKQTAMTGSRVVKVKRA